MQLFVDTTAQALVVGPNDTRRTVPPPVTVGDKLPIVLSFLQRNPQPLNTGNPVYGYVDMSAAGIVLSIGLQSMPPTGGSFVLSWGGNSTVPLAFNVSSYALSLALNALASITAAGGVTVTGNVGGPYQIMFVNPGSQPVLTVGANGLAPASTISCVIDQAGGTNISAALTLSLFQNAVVQVSSWTPQVAAAVSVASINGTITQRISIPPGTYGGSFTLTLNGNTTAPIPFAAQMDVVAAAVNALPGVTGATVWPGQNYWDITIPGNTFAFTGTAAGLIIPLTLTGTLDLTPQPLLDLLGGQQSALILFSIVATAGGNQTLYSGFFSVNEGPASGASSPTPGVIQIIPRPDINGITGTSNSLDKVVTASSAIAVGTIYVLTLPVGGFQAGGGWQLIGSPPASDGITSQRPLDYNSSTNNVGWIKLF